MRRVYSGGISCVCWLGDYRRGPESVVPQDASGVVDLIQFLNNDCYGPCPSTLATEIQRRGVGFALRTMMNASWWHRIWTVQEIVLPRTSNLVWGDISILWKSMLYAQAFLTSLPGIGIAQLLIDLGDFFHLDTTIFFFTVPIYSFQMIAGELVTPIDLFYRFRSRTATDPGINYGLLGLIYVIGFERI
ncbi:hypothetical protein F5Y16DRAFT_417704 [Xylariaceae sp. FL0255]|nr:hypothetical protein F5Y16DRAFT_417704 [Xylariaceae sp. FL0255]